MFVFWSLHKAPQSMNSSNDLIMKIIVNNEKERIAMTKGTSGRLLYGDIIAETYLNKVFLIIEVRCTKHFHFQHAKRANCLQKVRDILLQLQDIAVTKGERELI